MSITKITTPELLDFSNDSTSSANTSGTVIPTGTTGANVQYLVVAGGGGGAGNSSGGGGGGAGGVLTDTNNFILGVALQLTVGAGGAGTIGEVSTDVGGNGGNSVFSTITAIGGGGAANTGASSSADGGSGGGAPGGTAVTAGSGTSGQGNAGGIGSNPSDIGGGGGGAGGVGQPGGTRTGATDGQGGVALANSITGASVLYAGGGGAGVCDYVLNSTPATAGLGGGGVSGTGGNGGQSDASTTAAVNGGNGVANTGGGGGGGSRSASGSCNGGDGGSGIIILRVSEDTTASFSAGVTSTLTQVGGGTWTSGDKVYTITATSSGSETVTFASTGGSVRPATPSLNAGEFRFNTTLGYVEYYDGSNWDQIADEYITGQPTACICNYPTSAAALYEFQDNTNDTCGWANGIPNTITYTDSGKYGKAGVFNGTGYVKIPYDFNFSRSFAISCWIRPDTVSNQWQSIFGTDGYGASTHSGLNFYLNYAVLEPWVCVPPGCTGTGSGDVFQTGSVTVGVWQHIVLSRTYDSKWELFYNGSSLGTNTSLALTTNLTSQGASYIGIHPTSFAYEFNGDIDQLRIFTTDLTSTQVSELYNEIPCN